MCDWMKRENQLVTMSLSESHELKRGSLIRGKALDVMTSILHDSFLPKVCKILSLFHAIGAHNCMSSWSGGLLTIAVTSA